MGLRQIEEDNGIVAKLVCLLKLGDGRVPAPETEFPLPCLIVLDRFLGGGVLSNRTVPRGH
jgi:hypothetical protein